MSCRQVQRCLMFSFSLTWSALHAWCPQELFVSVCGSGCFMRGLAGSSRWCSPCLISSGCTSFNIWDSTTIFCSRVHIMSIEAWFCDGCLCVRLLSATECSVFNWSKYHELYTTLIELLKCQSLSVIQSNFEGKAQVFNGCTRPVRTTAKEVNSPL